MRLSSAAPTAALQSVPSSTPQPLPAIADPSWPPVPLRRCRGSGFHLPSPTPPAPFPQPGPLPSTCLRGPHPAHPDSSAFLSSRRRVVSSTPAPFLSPSLFPALVPVGQLCEPAPRPWEAPFEGPGLFHLERRVGSGRCFPQRPGPQKCRSYGKWEVEVLEDSWIVFTWMGNWCGLYRGCLFGSEAA